MTRSYYRCDRRFHTEALERLYVVGLLVGFVWEWMREYKVRAENARNIREVSRLNREVKRLRGDKYDGKDDIFALLDQAS